MFWPRGSLRSNRGSPCRTQSVLLNVGIPDTPSHEPPRNTRLPSLSSYPSRSIVGRTTHSYRSSNLRSTQKHFPPCRTGQMRLRDSFRLVPYHRDRSYPCLRGGRARPHCRPTSR